MYYSINRFFADSILFWLAPIDFFFQGVFLRAFCSTQHFRASTVSAIRRPTRPPAPFDTTEDHSPVAWKNSTGKKNLATLEKPMDYRRSLGKGFAGRMVTFWCEIKGPKCMISLQAGMKKLIEGKTIQQCFKKKKNITLVTNNQTHLGSDETKTLDSMISKNKLVPTTQFYNHDTSQTLLEYQP